MDGKVTGRTGGSNKAKNKEIGNWVLKEWNGMEMEGKGETYCTFITSSVIDFSIHPFHRHQISLFRKLLHSCFVDNKHDRQKLNHKGGREKAIIPPQIPVITVPSRSPLSSLPLLCTIQHLILLLLVLLGFFSCLLFLNTYYRLNKKG